MPEIIEISDVFRRSKTGPKTRPLRALRASVKISEVVREQVERAAHSIATAKIAEAVRGIRLSLIALANGRFEEAGNIAVNSAIEAAASFKEDPVMATRIIVTARGVVRNAIRGVMARSV